MNSFQTISAILLLGITTSCNSPKKDITTTPQLDTMFVEVQMRGEIPIGTLLSDSLAGVYISKADQFEPYPILSPSSGHYKAYQRGFYKLDENSYGKIINFEPDINDYCSIQLFIENNKGEILDAIELAYSYGEEGINGVGSSYIIRENKTIRIFTTKYWIVFEYYTPDEQENTDLVLDTLMAHEIRQQLKVPVPINSNTKIQMEKMFEER